MRGPLIAISFVSLALAWLVFFGAGVRQSDCDAALLCLGATAFFYWMFRTGQTPPRIPVWHAAALWGLPAYAALQLVPLPASVLAIVSPARSLISQSLSGVIQNVYSTPIAVSPAGAMFGLFCLLACLTVFSLVRDLEWRLAVTRPWMAVLPLVMIAAIQASIGVSQWAGGMQGPRMRGTLSTIEQFDGLLEVALPFALVFGFVCFRRYQAVGPDSSLPALRAAAGWLASALILVALFHTTSKTSHTVVFVSIFVLLTFALVPRLRTRNFKLIGAGTAAVIALAALLSTVSPADVSESLAQLGASEQENGDAKLVLWNSSANLLGEYRLFGAGMGGFESTFLKYEGSTDLNRISQPHNDVLALLIAFGIVGSCIAIAALIGVLRPSIMGAIFQSDESRRLLAASSVAAIVGVLVRSGLESAISSPAVAVAFAWVAGMSQSGGLE